MKIFRMNKYCVYAFYDCVVIINLFVFFFKSIVVGEDILMNEPISGRSVVL